MSNNDIPSSLHWRMRRGMKELDLVLNRWVQRRYATASSAQRERFTALLDEEDPDIWAWLMGYASPPEEETRELIEQLREYC